MKHAIMGLLIAGLGGCTSYGVVHTNVTQNSTPSDTGQFAYDRMLTAADLYTVIKVDVKVNGNALQPCTESLTLNSSATSDASDQEHG
jgi:hypothetical protein